MKAVAGSMPESLKDLEARCKAASMDEMYQILDELLYTNDANDDLKIAKIACQHLEARCKAASMDQMYQILEGLLYTDDDLKIACQKLNFLQKTEEVLAAKAHAKEMLKQTKRRELFDYVQQFLKEAALKEAALQEAALKEAALKEAARKEAARKESLLKGRIFTITDNTPTQPT